ncbi:Rossmann-like and DUF2520 domain-containing protein [Lentzea flaviverrucosa]|uniref:Predicted oxidoreductase, contains short-chain dehydrogenase (SDR) and DUF2520 domains n=1 Tax=Lentzea flaviverrucosa TaxID=200379 RepID=A0A1H9X450_9PSEU|nr:DUF2520 domain-containing protein [Lentzea flaviverrucosa]RDI20873.1 putative short-subunit dehydrogenase-like oxidoreductase (DUF2520 family) [Lentzea flaviverrucosa]SES40894.1 Predicted oxidoreductase, contains short-chain dehydrogenase (SDR) and DUF2520 domains [Lentzea flaviverrucosa]
MDATPRPARLAVGVISAGRVGSVLGAALARAGHVVTGVSAVSQASRNRADELLPDIPVADPTEVAARADLVLLAVPDDELQGLVKGLVATESLRAGQIVVHTSGAMGVQVLEPAAGLGALTIALHPVMTFTGRAEDLQRMSAACVGVTAADGDEVAWSVGEALVVEMDAEPVRIPEAVRPLYHSALAHGANHLITLVRDAADLLTGSGVANAERLLGPLLSAALDNALRHGDRALTGPVARGDTGTLRKHLGVLAQQAPEILPSYRVLARRTAERAEESGLLKPDAANDVRTTLED